MQKNNKFHQELELQIEQGLVDFADLDISMQRYLADLYIQGLNHDELDDISDTLNDYLGSSLNRFIPSLGRKLLQDESSKQMVAFRLEAYFLEHLRDYINQEIEDMHQSHLDDLFEKCNYDVRQFRKATGTFTDYLDKLHLGYRGL